MGSTSVHMLLFKFKIYMVSLFSPLGNTPPNLTSKSSPIADRHEFVVGYLQEDKRLTSFVFGLNLSHFLRTSSLSVMPPDMYMIYLWHKMLWLERGTINSETSTKVLFSGSNRYITLLFLTLLGAVPPITYMIPFYVATVRWNEGI